MLEEAQKNKRLHFSTRFIIMVTTTKYIGSDPSDEYATIAIWAAERRGSVGDGDTEEAVLRTGETHVFATQFGIFQGWPEVDYKILFRGAESHGGDWDTGAVMSATALIAITHGDQTVDYEFRDLDYRIAQGSYGFRYQILSDDGLGDAYSGSMVWDRCLITSDDRTTDNTFILDRHHLENSTTSALGSVSYKFKSCVLDLGQRGGTGTLAGSTYRSNRLWEVIGCTVRTGITGVYFNTRGYGDTFEAFTSGTIYHNDSNARPLFYNGTSGVAVDYITSERDIYAPWIDTETNVTYQPGFNYDNTVTTGEVCFVGPSGYKGNYKLVDDTDNLAVDYVTNADLSNITDVANNSRGSSPFDAGAYQIVADTGVTINFGNTYIRLY